MLPDGRVIDTSQPTFGDPYTIVYTVTNAAGLSASVRRTVEVADPCPAQFGTGWVYCTSTGSQLATLYVIASAWSVRGLHHQLPAY